MIIIILLVIAGLAVIARKQPLAPVLMMLSGLGIMFYGWDYWSTSREYSILLVAVGLCFFAMSIKGGGKE